jgi:hypothetical protein
MFFLFSGEGPTDFGNCSGDALACNGDHYQHGPMAVIVDHIVERDLGYSLLESGHFGFVSKRFLIDQAKELASKKKAPLLPGRKRPRETGYFFRNARAFAVCALNKERESQDQVVAVLFRDADGTASSGRGEWQQKWDSMLSGFSAEGYVRGVPMIPKPKSEAWFVCALKKRPYNDCDAIEDRSGNDASPNSLKSELAELCHGSRSRIALCEIVNNREFDVGRITMMSFVAFRDRLREAVR